MEIEIISIAISLIIITSIISYSYLTTRKFSTTRTSIKCKRRHDLLLKKLDEVDAILKTMKSDISQLKMQLKGKNNGW